MYSDKWQIDDDGVSIGFKGKMPILWTHQSMEVWFELEDGQELWSEHQKKSFDNFRAIHAPKKYELGEIIEQFYNDAVLEKRIEPMEYRHILETIEWLDGMVCVPQLYDSKNEYVILLLDTKWKLSDSEFNLELEILFTNSDIELVQEMTGLWNRIEWFDDYIQREVGPNKS